MKFGYFDDDNREYVITLPTTPYPWINYLGNEDYFALFSNTSGGYSFYKDARLMRITRYRYNNVPVDNEGKYFFIKDNDTIWNIGYKPSKTPLDFYECRHGMGYSKISSSKNGVSASQLSFVPLDYKGEIHAITIKNETDTAKDLQLYSYVEWCLWDALDDMLNYQRNYSIGEVEIENSAIYHKTEYRERRNHYAFYNVNEKLSGYDTDRETFVGLYNSIAEPQVVSDGKSQNSHADGWAPIASHNINFTLKPGEEKTLIFNLGLVENEQSEKFTSLNVINKAKAYEMQKRFDTMDKVDAALAKLNKYWDNLLGKYQVTTPDEKVNRMVNIWNTYQCMITFNLSRSASYFESGVGRGMGFRDSNQDVLGFVHQVPERARMRILDLAATQLEDGSAYHQYQPLTKKGNDAVGSGFNDDPLWLIAAVSAYIRETGDLTILDEMVPYNNDESKAAPLLDHIDRSFMFTHTHRGPHSLPLIGQADWNDCLNLNCFSSEPGESFQTLKTKGDASVAESIFIAGLFTYTGKEYYDILVKKGMDDRANEVLNIVNEMKNIVAEHGYDGEWFLRAYDANGDKVGSKDNKEGKIYIEPQGMCVLGEIGTDNGMAEKALDSAWKYLDCDYGMVLLNPCYTEYHLELGEISSYPGGYKENAGVFCHNNPWVVCAECVVGRGDNAYKLYKQSAPAYQEEISEIHRTEPYVYSQMVAGKDAKRMGEAKNSWLTGASAWNYVAITQYILGIRADINGLMVDPCIPKDWNEFTATRVFRGTEYDITIKNPDNISKGVKSMTVDGKKVDGNIIPEIKSSKPVKVEVLLG